VEKEEWDGCNLMRCKSIAGSRVIREEGKDCSLTLCETLIIGSGYERNTRVKKKREKEWVNKKKMREKESEFR